MRDYSRFQSQFRETEAERKKRLRDAYKRERAAFKCTHGHDMCSQMYAGPECPYCEIVKQPA